MNKIQLKKDVWYSIVIITLLMVMVAMVGHYSESHATENMLSPLGKEKPTKIIIKEVYAKEGDPIISEISRVFKKEGTRTVGKMISCLYGESRMNINAYNFNNNGTADMGLGQINDVWGMSIEDRRDPIKSINKIYEIYKKQGFNAWHHPNCR